MFNKLWSREYTVQYCECAMRTTCPDPDVAKHLTFAMHKAFMITEDRNQSYYVDSDEMNGFQQALLKVFNSPRLLNKTIYNFHRFGEEYIRTARNIGLSKLSALDNRALAQKIILYTKKWKIYTVYLWLGWYLNELAAEKGRAVIQSKNLYQKIIDQILLVLFSPIKRTSILKLQDALLKFKKQKKLPATVLAGFQKEYAWMSCLDLQNDPWTKSELQDFFEHLVVPRKSSFTFDQAAKLAHLKNKELQLFKAIRQLSYIKDMRDEYRRKGVFGILPLFEEIGRRLNLSRQEVAQMTTQEIVQALTTAKVDRKEIKARDKGFVCFYRGSHLVISTKRKDFNFIKKKIQKEQNSLEVVGISASKGKVRGKAKIIFNVSDLKKVSKGDILVAITTHPDFVPAMQKAAAIATDEGGLTSHAAIVARELKIPCIVGTKAATKALKDGDLVEVDANRGIVKKLSN